MGKIRAGLASGVWVLLLFVALFGVVLNVPVVDGDYETIYIRPDGSIDPPTAPIATNDNITYTVTDSIEATETGIHVLRDNIILDGADHIIQKTGSRGSNGIWVEGEWTRRINVTVKNTEIRGFETGILLDYSSGNIISGNNITENEYGIYVEGSIESCISGNSIMRNTEIGITLSRWSSNNIISGNNIIANGESEVWSTFHLFSRYGLCLYSVGNTVLGNNFVGDGLFVGESSNGNSVLNNLVNGKPLVYLENISDERILNAGQVVLVNCTRIRVEDLNLSHTDIGIELLKTSNATILRNDMTNNHIGVYLHISSNNTIIGNNITGSSNFGMCIEYTSYYNNVSENTIKNSSVGIYLYAGWHNAFSGNLIESNSVAGVYFDSSHNCTFSGNKVTDNHYGIYLFDSRCVISGNNIASNNAAIYVRCSSNNTVIGNNVTNNQLGICLDFALNNMFFHNNLIDNINHVHANVSQDIWDNIWDDGYPSGGNYWSDYGGIDADHDGIGDTPYTIDANNIDHYPLMTQYIIPEFPSFLIIPLFMITTPLAIIVYRRKHRVQNWTLYFQ